MQIGLSNLIFNQACAGSSPAIPINFRVGCSSTARASHCECEDDEFDSRQPTQSLTHGALGQSGLSRLSLNQESNGSNPLRAVSFHGTVAER
jgi:hypothetical protein